MNKAPAYIWRWDSRDWPMTHYADPVSGGPNWDVKAHPDAVRYLLSELTCSDCFLLGTSDCQHAGGNVYPEQVACMAFTVEP